MNSLLSWMTATFGGILTKEALAFVISMVPILELRGGLIFPRRRALICGRQFQSA